MSTSSSDPHPDFSCLNEINLIARATCVYLGISTKGVPLNPLRVWIKMIRCLDVMEANVQQDSAELHNLRTRTESQAREIQALQNKAPHLELASTPATVTALQDN